MRGSLAKKLRKFAKNDTEDTPWVAYRSVRRSHHSMNESVYLDPNCQRAYYLLLKKIWKAS